MDETQRKLLNAAGEVFAAQGFEAATVREICQRSGTNIAAINYHFGSKERLYIEAVKSAHCYQHSAQPLEFPPDLPLEQALGCFVREMMVDMLDRDSPSWHLELMMRELARPTAACEELVRSYIGPKFAMLEGILDGLLPPNLPPTQRQLFAFSIVGQCLLYRFHRPIGKLLIGEAKFNSLFNVELLADHITRFSLAGIQAANVQEAIT